MSEEGHKEVEKGGNKRGGSERERENGGRKGAEGMKEKMRRPRVGKRLKGEVADQKGGGVKRRKRGG